MVRDISGGVGLTHGDRFDESAEYYEITNSGSVIKKHGAPQSLSLEDKLFVSGIHLVIGDALYDFCWSRRYPDEAGLEVKMLLHGLQPCDGPLPFDAEAAIRDYEQDNNRPLASTNDDSNPAGSAPSQAAAEGVTLAPSDGRIPAGIPHRALCDIEMLVYDYDAMRVKTEVLPAGGIFQPWEPLDHWRGIQIPITLGDRAAEFDWGVTAYEGHFLAWGDFFSRCRMRASESDASDS